MAIHFLQYKRPFSRSQLYDLQLCTYRKENQLYASKLFILAVFGSIWTLLLKTRKLHSTIYTRIKICLTHTVFRRIIKSPIFKEEGFFDWTFGDMLLPLNAAGRDIKVSFITVCRSTFNIPAAWCVSEENQGGKNPEVEAVTRATPILLFDPL